jgi:transcriptional regulator with XRE-family HTH domain
MIGCRIRAYRKNKNIKVADFAALICISEGSLSDIEIEKTRPSSETLAAIVRNTDIDANWLLTGKGTMNPQPMTISEKMVDYSVVQLSDLTPADKKKIKLRAILDRIVDAADERAIALLESQMEYLDPGKKQGIFNEQDAGDGVAGAHRK